MLVNEEGCIKNEITEVFESTGLSHQNKSALTAPFVDEEFG